MTRLRAWIRAFFGFSRTETNAFLIMLPLMAILVLSNPIYKWWWVNHPDQSEQDNTTIDSLIATWKWEKADSSHIVPPARYFPFNPNTATATELAQLGVSDKLAQRIVHYRSRGGKFRIKHDLSKIYGMDSLLYLQLVPYIDLPQKIKSTPTRVQSQTKIWTPPKPFDLNSADTSQLIKINGIGPKLSLRITAYRNRLGGFISMDQLTEVFGLDTAVISRLKKQCFITENFVPHKININTASEKQLSTLPYLRFALAKSIAAYRFQHGEFNSIDEIRNITLINEPTFQKIKPYITVKD